MVLSGSKGGRCRLPSVSRENDADKGAPPPSKNLRSGFTAGRLPCRNFKLKLRSGFTASKLPCSTLTSLADCEDNAGVEGFDGPLSNDSAMSQHQILCRQRGRCKTGQSYWVSLNWEEYEESEANSRLQGPCAHEPYAVKSGHVHALGGEVQDEVVKKLAKGDCFSIAFSHTLHLVVHELDETRKCSCLRDQTMLPWWNE